MTPEFGYHPEFPVDYPDVYQEYQEYQEYQGGGGRHRAPADEFCPPLVAPDSSWDPAEELAFMLRDSIEQQPRIPAARHEDHLAGPAAKTPREALVELTAELPPVKAPPRGHRKVRARQRPSNIRIAGYVIVALATAIASAVSTFGGLIAYDPLRFVAASRTQSSVVSWWPLLVFGPWLVASLSILRAALYQRRAFHSWSVLLVFSAIAMTLCAAQAPRDIVSVATAALPTFASLACFQQVVRQITLTRPPRRSLPRHRVQPPEALTEEAVTEQPPQAGVPSAGGDRPQKHHERFSARSPVGAPLTQQPENDSWNRPAVNGGTVWRRRSGDP
ncbi:DUF2637 domain-containing protein [Streptomyces echinatus]|uniref:Integral membrane protein n=1 Tax=Streptomyces echinatus TaxID=67293 RepID=A0A7W9PT02_9ACTN|nr:DUF2637 domain-containing protein [Streptomyces echinatus]MBB5927246.1 hypothetical protein [Streptomyces echinatus]